MLTMIWKFRVWKDETMATRTSIKWAIFHVVTMMTSIIGMLFWVSLGVGSGHSMDSIIFADLVGIVPAAIILIIAAYQFADEIRFLRSNKD